MIQRIQSVYLLLGAITVAALVIFRSVLQGPGIASASWLPVVLLVLGSLIAIGAVAAIFLYRNRTQQRQIVLGLQILDLLFLVVLFVGLYLAGALLPILRTALGIAPFVVILLPVAAYILFYLARKDIERDIRLVRSMDRLR